MTPVTGTASDNVDNLSELNRSAWHALMGMSVSWENDLIALLRSDEPIHFWVRSALADIVAGESELGIRLSMAGHKALRDATLAVASRRNWVRIGNWIENMREGGSTRAEAVNAASSIYGASAELCDGAVDYRNRYRRWRDSLPSDNPFFALMSEDGIENIFHQMIHYDEPLDGPDGLVRARAIVAECINEAPDG